MLILFHRQNMLCSLMRFLCSFRNQNNWPRTFSPLMSRRTSWQWTHNTYCQPQWNYFIFLFLAESDNALHTKHRTNKTHDSNGWGCTIRKQLHVGGYEGLAGVVYICTVWTLKQGQTLGHTSMGWLGQSKNYWHSTMLSQTARLWSESEELESITWWYRMSQSKQVKCSSIMQPM
jgi:hypothetical protein